MHAIVFDGRRALAYILVIVDNRSYLQNNHPYFHRLAAPADSARHDAPSNVLDGDLMVRYPVIVYMSNSLPPSH